MACLQGSFGLIGFFFDDEDEGVGEQGISNSDDDEKVPTTTQVPWGQLMTSRLCVGALAAFTQYLVDGFLGATLLQYMSVHLAPTTVSESNLGLMFRSWS